jgi:hypothetical protein
VVGDAGLVGGLAGRRTVHRCNRRYRKNVRVAMRRLAALHLVQGPAVMGLLGRAQHSSICCGGHMGLTWLTLRAAQHNARFIYKPQTIWRPPCLASRGRTISEASMAMELAASR